MDSLLELVRLVSRHVPFGEPCVAIGLQLLGRLHMKVSQRRHPTPPSFTIPGASHLQPTGAPVTGRG
jgi:hypothetical protein